MAGLEGVHCISSFHPKASPTKLESVGEGHKRESTYSDASSSSLEKVLGGSTEEKQEKRDTQTGSSSSGVQREDHKEEVEARTALTGYVYGMGKKVRF